jgi:hypothetical protein
MDDDRVGPDHCPRVSKSASAFVLSQFSTGEHVSGPLAHAGLGRTAAQHARDLGQILRIVGAATKTAIGLIPTGNICGSQVSPFKRLSIPKDLAGTLAAASKQPPIQITHRS